MLTTSSPDGVAPNTVSTWKHRGTIDVPLILAKCEGVDLNWLLRGEESTGIESCTDLSVANEEDILELWIDKQVTKAREVFEMFHPNQQWEDLPESSRRRYEDEFVLLTIQVQAWRDEYRARVRQAMVEMEKRLLQERS